MSPEIKGPALAKGSPELFAAVMAKLGDAQVANEMPERHAPPPGEAAIFWVGEPDALAAFAVAWNPYPTLVWLDLIWVAPEHRRKGLGKALLLAVLNQAKRTGFDEIQLGTEPKNEAMQALGRLLGFAPDAIVLGRKL